MRTKFVLMVALFIGSLVTAAFIVAKVTPSHQGQGFTLAMQTVDYRPGETTPIFTATQMRYVKADGNWKLVTTYIGGRIDVGFGQIGRGVFHVNEGKNRLDYLSGYTPMDASENRLRQLPGFVGEEKILGVNTFHFHNVSDETGEITDTFIAPELQGYPVRIVTAPKGGAKHVHEVTRILWGEPSFTVPDYPVDTTQYEQIHNSQPVATSQPR